MEYFRRLGRPWGMRLVPAMWTTILPLFLGISCVFYEGHGHRWWRSHGGDILVVAFLVGLLGALTTRSLRWRLCAVAILSAGLELGQLIPGSASRAGVRALVLGTHFDPLDFLYYACGLLVATILHRSSLHRAFSRA